MTTDILSKLLSNMAAQALDKPIEIADRGIDPFEVYKAKKRLEQDRHDEPWRRKNRCSARRKKR